MKLALEKRRDESRKKEITNFLLATTSLLALPLYLVFWFADLLYVPHLKWQFLSLRAVIIPVCLISNWLIKKTRTSLESQLITSAFILGNSAILTTMIFLAEGAGSPYYAGLNLVAFVLLYMPLTKRFIVLNMFILFGPYVLLGTLTSHGKENWTRFALNMFFVVGALVIAVVIRFFLERLRKSEIKAQSQLELELENREKIIQRKTEESIRLSQLTKQFSPQVAHSIQEGMINLDTTQRRDICVIFVDVVGSTGRIQTIPLDNFNTALSRFLEICVRSLIRQDITVDKFTGDGIMGFSNAPLERIDYVRRVLNAALDIRNKLELHQSAFQELWKKEFSIRIGIARGNAIVGFLGSSQSMKAYTAIGASVNLAARLCQSASDNEIWISEDAIHSPGLSTYEFEPVGTIKLKGFEESKHQIFRVLRHGDAQTNGISTSNQEICFQCQSVLHLETDTNGIYHLTCRSCGAISTENEPKIQVA